jgi:hypothetical protein
MGIEQQAEKLGRKLQLKGSWAFYGGAAALILFGIVAWLTLRPVGDTIAASLQSGFGKAKGMLGSGAAAAGTDSDIGGLA